MPSRMHRVPILIGRTDHSPRHMTSLLRERGLMVHAPDARLERAHASTHYAPPFARREDLERSADAWRYCLDGTNEWDRPLGPMAWRQGCPWLGNFGLLADAVHQGLELVLR